MGAFDAQIGIAAETTVGTPVTVTRFYEFLSESMKLNIDRMRSAGLGRGRVQRSHQVAAGRKIAAGAVNMETWNKSLGLWLKHSMGTVVTTQPAVGTDPTVYDHTFTPGDLSALALTYQAGRPDEAGVVRPFTYDGCVVTGWDLACALGEIGKFNVALNGEDETTATALAAKSYPTGLELLTFVGSSLSIGGSAVDVANFNVAGDNVLKVDRGKLGQATRTKAMEGAVRPYTGTADLSFAGFTAYNRFVNRTEAEIVALFEGSTISNSYKHQLKITANVVFNGETPTIGGPDEIRQAMPFEVVDPGAGGISVLYRTTDSQP